MGGWVSKTFKKEMLLHFDGLNSIRQCFSHFSSDVICRHRVMF